MLCHSCGRTLDPNAQFCGECGAQVGAIASTPLDDSGVGAGPVTTPDLPAVPPVAPPLVPPPGAPLPPPPPGATTFAGVAGAGGTPPEGSSQRWALWLIGALVVLVVAFLASVAYYVVRDDSDGGEAAPATTVSVPVAPTFTTEVPTTETPDVTEPDTPPTTAPDVTDGGAATVEEFCANAEALGQLLQDAIDDPFSADVGEITERSSQLSEDAATLSESATPEELQQISDCTAALNVTP